MVNGDMKEAEKFLQAEQGETSYDVNQLKQMEGGIPKDYPGQGKAAAPKGPFADFNAKKEEKNEQIEERIRNLFVAENISYQEHYDFQNKQYELYVAVLLLLTNQGVEISKASRPRVLAAAWARRDKHLSKFLMSKDELFALPQVLSAINLLDAGRKKRAIEKKIARIDAQKTAKAKTVGNLKSVINDLNREAHIGAVSGSLCKQIKKWASLQKKEDLEFYALIMPKDLWKELADIVHFHPTDFACPWFLEYMFGKEPPADSLIPVCAKLTADNVVANLKAGFKIPYSFLRTQVKPLPDEAKLLVAQYAPIDALIWFYEELVCAGFNDLISKRLDTEMPSFGYGKLMERLLYFKGINAPFFTKLMPVAEERLRRIRLQLESPVSVIGDASYSMDVAIRVATVIASVLCCLVGAELKFFTGECVDPPLLPKNCVQVLELTTAVKADGLTAPASVLWHYYSQKKVVKFFIVVTDEIENEKYKSEWFPSLFAKYYREVFPAKIVFVSFLPNPSEKGRMVTALESLGIPPLQFKLDGKRPDLTKLDSLLGMLASESSFFPAQARDIAQVFKVGGWDAAIKAISQPPTLYGEGVSHPAAPLLGAEGKKEEDSNNNNVVVKEEDVKNAQKFLQSLEQGMQVTGPAKECVICQENEADTALLDCGHLNYCSKCAEALVGKDCPICRQKVLRTIKIYHA
jgi:hypothetical protein